MYNLLILNYGMSLRLTSKQGCSDESPRIDLDQGYIKPEIDFKCAIIYLQMLLLLTALHHI